jgi:hypothetical protein
MRRVHFRTTLALSASSILLLGCADVTPPDRSGTFFGSVTTMAAGTARGYVTLDRGGAPVELGVAISESALTALPAVSTELIIVLPSEASATPFRHAAVNWQPQGHPPPMLYTVPHFDFHFYSITEGERNAIMTGGAELDEKMIRQPAAEFIPADYVPGMSSAKMGLHWNDPNAPERHGEPFTKSFIYGSYDGAFIFAEPMVSKAYLESKPVDVVTSIKLPTQFAVRGHQPTSYTVTFDARAKEYRIALSGLVAR